MHTDSEAGGGTAHGHVRRRRPAGASDLDRRARRLILGVSTLTAAALVSNATFNYVITPMTQELDATHSQQSLLRQLPSIGALLVIFLAGVLGNRVGPRRFLTFSAASMGLGYALVLVAIVCLYSLGLIAASASITNSIMKLAAPGGQRAAPPPSAVPRAVWATPWGWC